MTWEPAEGSEQEPEFKVTITRFVALTWDLLMVIFWDYGSDCSSILCLSLKYFRQELYSLLARDRGAIVFFLSLALLNMSMVIHFSLHVTEILKGVRDDIVNNIWYHWFQFIAGLNLKGKPCGSCLLSTIALTMKNSNYYNCKSAEKWVLKNHTKCK